jgi:hypothetical protein
LYCFPPVRMTAYTWGSSFQDGGGVRRDRRSADRKQY